MVFFCCVPGCGEKNLSSRIGISSHRFPADDATRRLWIRLIRNDQISEDSSTSDLKKYTVCGKHFMPSDYEEDPKYAIAPHLYKVRPRKYLKKTAVPSQLLPPSSEPEIVEAFLDDAPAVPSEQDIPVEAKRPKRKAETVTSGAYEQLTPAKVRRVQEIQSASSMTSSPTTSQLNQPMSPQKTPQKTLIAEDMTSSPFSLISSADKFSSPGWQTATTASSLSSSDSTDSTEDDSLKASTKKVIVNVSSLEEFFKRCQVCGEGIDSTATTYRGAQICITWQCVQGHSDTWKSCSDIRRMPEINLLASASTLFSGNTFTSISRFCNFLNVEFFKPTTFQRIQNTYLLPVIDQYYNSQHLDLVGEMVLNGMEKNYKYSLLGDGRSDSPGFSAKYTTYSMMEEKTEKIVDYQLVQVTEATSSVAMEKVGFDRSMEYLTGHGVQVESVTTDRSPSIIKFMRENYPDIVHQFDVWHVCKGIKKKLVSIGRKKNNELLLKWTKSITNHFWYCCARCDGSYDELKRKWLSLLNHVIDVHDWNEGGKFFKCDHADLCDEEREKKKWCTDGSDQLNLLKKVVTDKKLLNDMSKLTLFKHTGTLESYHNMMLKYIPKRIHFHFTSMNGRTQLAIIDHNFNVGRKQAVTKKNKPRYAIVGRKQDAGSFKARKIFESKDYSYVDQLMKMTVERRNNENVEMQNRAYYVPVRGLPSNIYKTAVPPREEVIRQSKILSKFQ